MSAHYSKFGLNTYYGSPYFQTHLPEDYPLSLVLQKSRAFRRLPPHLRELSARAKEWARRIYPLSDFQYDIDRWYDEDGYELNPGTGQRLTDEEIDADWEGTNSPEIEVEDIPIPDGGFPDPDTWEEPKQEPEEVVYEGPSVDELIGDIGSYGREYTARYYGIPADEVKRAGSDADLARTILKKIQPAGA